MEFGENNEIVTKRVPCQFCSRKFVPESLIKHVNVCEKTLHKKRNIFDSAKQRIRGTELAEFLPTRFTSVRKNENISYSQSKEKQTPVIQATDTVHSVPSPKTIKTTSPLSRSSNYERCAYCDRSFGPKAFDRHIEWCKDQCIRINLKSSATQEAKERLEARTKYRAPSFKSRRSITKEKYSSKINNQDCRNGLSNTNDGHKEKDVKISKPYEIEPKVKISDNMKPKENKEVNFIRQDVLRSSYKIKLPKKTKTITEKNQDFSEIRDWISTNGTQIKPSPTFSKTSPTYSQLSCSIYDDYDPFVLAEHQMKELLDDSPPNEKPMNQTYTLNNPAYVPTSQSKEEHRNKCQNKENISDENFSLVKMKSSEINKTENSEKYFKPSPISAFSKFSVLGNSEKNIMVSTPVVSSETGKEDFGFLPPITNNIVKHESQNQIIHNAGINRYPLISLSNLSLCSSVSVNVPGENGKQVIFQNSKIHSDVEIPLIKRSVSASKDKQNKNNIQKTLKMEYLLYENEQNHSDSIITSDILLDKYDEKLQKLNNLLDDENFASMNSFVNFETDLQNSLNNDTFTVNSKSPAEKRNMHLERDDSIVSKVNTDSAYNSLNRKSPITFETQNFNGRTSTPEADMLKSTAISLSSYFLDRNQLPQQKLSKFCHSCGARFPLAIAKFCCECGIRRLVI